MNFKSVLTLIRFPNLLIIVLTQYLIRYCIIEPMLKYSGFELQLSHLDFFLLCLSTVMIAAAGYIINDYFDTKTDQVNRPERVVIDKGVRRRIAIAAHLIVNLIAIAIGFFMGFKVGVYKLGIIHVFAAGLLWFYSTDFKRQFLIGNVLVSILTALVPLMVVLFEIPLLNNTYRDILIEANTNFNHIFRFVAAFAIFAFLISLIREIIKDMEDVEGDKVIGSRTLPIVLGYTATKGIVSGFILLTISLLGYIQYTQLLAKDVLSFAYLLICIQSSLLFLIYLLFRARSAREFHRASSFTKAIMLLGIFYSFIIYYILTTSSR